MSQCEHANTDVPIDPYRETNVPPKDDSVSRNSHDIQWMSHWHLCIALWPLWLVGWCLDVKNHVFTNTVTKDFLQSCISWVKQTSLYFCLLLHHCYSLYLFFLLDHRFFHHPHTMLSVWWRLWNLMGTMNTHTSIPRTTSLLMSMVIKLPGGAVLT